MNTLQEFKQELKRRGISIPEEDAKAIFEKHTGSKESIFSKIKVPQLRWSTSIAVASGVVALLLIGAILLRYDLNAIAVGESVAVAYQLDRWTGTVYYVTPYGRWEVQKKSGTP